MNTETKYTFGDTPTADDRLKRIASFFNPLAKEFIQSQKTQQCNLAIDLGCGPGYTTKMVCEATDANKVIGLDKSEVFVKAASEHFPKLIFQVHDVAQNKIPYKADVMYVRFLLSHLKNTQTIIEKWIEALAPGGMLFIDELEAIRTDHPLFHSYLKVSDALVHSQGANLYIGKKLDEDCRNMHLIYNESVILPVQNTIAASWFYPNTVSVWKTDNFVASMLNEKERNEIALSLFDLSQGNDQASEITWIMKRIIIQK